MMIRKSLLVVLIAMAVAVGVKAKQDRPNIVWLTSEDNSANWYRLYNPEHGAASAWISGSLGRTGAVT